MNKSVLMATRQTLTLVLGFAATGFLILFFIWFAGFTLSIMVGLGLGLGEILFFATVIRYLAGKIKLTPGINKAMAAGEIGPVLREVGITFGFYVLAPIVVVMLIPKLDWQILYIISGLTMFCLGSLLASVKKLITG